MGSNEQNTITINSTKLLSPFSSSTGATTLISDGITAGYTSTSLIKNKFDISNATFATQEDLEAAIKTIILDDIVNSGITVSNLTCGYVSTDFSENITLSGGVYYITSNTISNNTNKCVAYTTYVDIVDCFAELIAALVTSYGFTHSTMILQSTPITTTTMLGGDPQILAIEISTITGIMGTYGGSFLYDIYREPCLTEAGIVKCGSEWDYATSTNKKLHDALIFLEYIYETTNRTELAQSNGTTQLLNAVKNENVPLTAEPTSGTFGWNHSIINSEFPEHPTPP